MSFLTNLVIFTIFCDFLYALSTLNIFLPSLRVFVCLCVSSSTLTSFCHLCVSLSVFVCLCQLQTSFCRLCVSLSVFACLCVVCVSLRYLDRPIFLTIAWFSASLLKHTGAYRHARQRCAYGSFVK